MSDTVKLIIEISEHQYEICKQALKDFGDRPITECEFVIAVGTPLDDVKAEIREKSFDHYFECGEYIGEDCRKERIIYLDQILDILDNIGKAESEDT